MANIFEQIGPVTPEKENEGDAPINFNDIGPNTSTFNISETGDIKLDRYTTQSDGMSEIGPADFDGNKSWFDAFSYGAKLGFTDTYRGAKQMAGINKEEMQAQQKELYARMQDDDYGFWTTAGYFGGAILDPVTWLLPFMKAKTVLQMARYGAASGAFFGATGYVDEDSILDTRTKQALAGAVGGTILTPLIGKAAQYVTGRKLKSGLISEGDIKVKSLNDSTLKRARVVGRIGEDLNTIKIRADKDIELKNPRIIKDIPTQNQVNANRTLRGPRFFLNNYLVKPYQDKIGKPTFEYLKSGKYGAELGTGFAGAIVSPQYLEEDASLLRKFGTAAMGFIGGVAGVSTIKKIPKKVTMLKGSPSEYQKSTNLGEYLARGMVDDYGLSFDVKKMKIFAKGMENKLADRFVQIAERIEGLSTDEQRLLLNLMEGDTVYGYVPKKLKTVSKEFRSEVTKLSQMMVDFGLITAETAKSNIKTYLRRTYTKDEALAKVGDELKPRGFHIRVSKAEYIKHYKKDIAYEIDAGNDINLIKAFKKIRLEEQEKIGTKEYIDIVNKLINKNKIKDHKGWEVFNVSSTSGNTKLNKVIESAPVGSKEFNSAFKKLKDTDEIVIRWQLTKQERNSIGQIENASLAIAETARIMAGELGRNAFYNKLAKSSYAYTNPSRIDIKDLNLVKIPDTIIQKTKDKKVYGSLAGKYLTEEVADNIIRTNNYYNKKPGAFYERYKKLNQLWKVSKTAFNPTVHVNNSLSNIILYDLVDGNNLRSNLKTAHGALMAAGRGERSELYTLAKNYNVLDSDLVTQELQDITKFLKTDPYKNIKLAEDEFNNAVSIGNIMWQNFKNTGGGLFSAADAAVKLYRYEDQVFRIALFKDRLLKGYSVEDAALDAKKSFIDYDINAPMINTLRNSATPFLAYTYRVVPLLAETAIVRPWKYAKYGALAYGLNAAGGYFGGGDEAAERAAFTKDKEGPIFGIPAFPERNIKLPVQINNNSAYIDITRFIPGGDVLEVSKSNFTRFPGIPAPLQPSFGIAGDVIPALFGYDLFAGGKIKGIGGDYATDWKQRGKKVISSITPNFPFFPGSYSTQNIERARLAPKDSSPFRSDRTELMEFFRSVGFKVNEADIEKLSAQKGLEFQKRIAAERELLTDLAKQFNNNKITEQEYLKGEKKLLNKMERIVKIYDKRFEKMGSYSPKEPKSILDAVKDISKQTDILFNKK